jgi:predicted RNase H-like HicB family nuclease
MGSTGLERIATTGVGGADMRIEVLTAVLHKEEDLYVAECPEVGTVSQGHSVEEAVVNLKEATELYLEEFALVQTTPPLLTTFEVAVNA